MHRPLFLLIDIDNTLYEFAETGFGIELRDAICEYVMAHLNITLEEAHELSHRYLNSFGISLYGYYKEHHIDTEDYSNFVHRCSYHILQPNKPLVDMLTRLQYNKSLNNTNSEHQGNSNKQCDYKECISSNNNTTTNNNNTNNNNNIEQNGKMGEEEQEHGVHHLYFFTNANRAHARHVLTPLGLKPLFTRTVQPNSPVYDLHKRLDAHEFDDENEWYGFSYEDQWHLTKPEIANKPMRRAFEAVFNAIDDEIRRDEEIILTNTTNDNAQEENKKLCGSIEVLDSHEDAGGTISSPSDKENVEDNMETRDKGIKNNQTSVPWSQCSPSLETIEHRRRHLKPENMVMVDDSLRNIIEPLKLGWNAVWYAHDDAQLPQDDAFLQHAYASHKLKIIRHILELERAVHELAQMTENNQ